MIPTQNFENYPEFANAGQKSQPNDAKYAAGFIPSDVLPAEWLNWFLNGATKGVTALNTGVKSVEQEINTVLESRSVNPDINAAGQLLSVLNKIKVEAVLAAHPVGSLYWTSKNENPAVTFGGGTWKQITDKFVLAAGSTYKAESTGGASTVTLSVSNMPSHSHTFTPSGTITMNAHNHGLNSHTHSFTPSGTITMDAHSHGLNNHTHSFVHTHKYSWSGTTSEMSGDTTVTHPGHTINGTFSDRAKYGNQNGEHYNYSSSGRHEPQEVLIDLSHTHTYSGSGTTSSQSTSTTSSASGNTTQTTSTGSFTGTAGTTGGNSDNTTSTTSTGTFKGTTETTKSNGEGTSFSILPPYIVKYCWERTA